jgi:hypothetical protein
MNTSVSATHIRPPPTRVPAFPKGGVPPFLHSFMPPILPIWLKDKLIGTSTRLDPTLRQEMIDGLWQGDAPMDDLVTWMFSVGAKQGKQLFDQALEHGISSVPDAPEALKAFFTVIDQRPDWVDMAEVDRGARAINTTGEIMHYMARDFALMGGYLLSGLNEPLVMTGALNKGTGRRFAETQSWAMDIFQPGSMTRFGAGFKSTIRVRMIHGLVRRNLQRKPEWDFDRLGIPINQTDMLATILSNVAISMSARMMGVPLSRREVEAFTHHGRYTAWVMGVKEEWAFKSSAEGFRYLLHAASTQPRGEETSRIMAQSLANEPLTRHFPRLQNLRRQIAYSKHLSISSMLLSRRTLHSLGVPVVLPWYPVLTIGPRLLWQSAHRLLPGGYNRLVNQGLQTQLDMLDVFHAGAKSAAGIIQPDAHHPAHV